MERTAEQRLAALEARVSLLEDKARLEELYSRHNFYYSAGQGERIVPELWSKDVNASLEYGASGVYRAEEGSWKLKTFYVKEAIPGRFSTFTAANHVLEVAEDGMSARGVWMVIGTETDAGELSSAPPAANDERRPLLTTIGADGRAYRAEVLLQRHEVRFVREDGQWKIHDLHIGEYFRCPAGSDWVAWASGRQVTDGIWLEGLFASKDEIYPRWGTMRAENLPSEASTCHWQYDVDALPAQLFAVDSKAEACMDREPQAE